MTLMLYILPFTKDRLHNRAVYDFKVPILPEYGYGQ
jgi:hypothetical protein